MRKVIPINDNWKFVKSDAPSAPADAVWESVTLPHSWNAVDGMDGSRPWRGSAWYEREIEIPREPTAGGRLYVEVGAAPLAAEVYLNGKPACTHKGGYAAFRAELTGLVAAEGKNVLSIRVDNSDFPDIYPRTADFTFYGGLTRGVKLISVPATHFALGHYGSAGIAVTPSVKDGSASVRCEAWLEGATDGMSVCFEIRDGEGKKAAEVWRPASEHVSAEIPLENAHLWSTDDPYLYTATARLFVHNEGLDEVTARFGVRTFSVDPQKGFFLNGKLTVLRGVARHQDRMYKGSAVSPEDHIEDADLICEVGANTVRCAHYQHSPEFYDLCDERGLVVWAEIPYISVQSEDPNAHEVAKNMLRELIIQNYNHPSICFWGISNEILIGGEREGVVENHRELNELAKSLDPTRLTTMAHVSFTEGDHPIHGITDVEAYNQYMGWYGGKVEDNGPWLDSYHAQYPDRALGLSEYGAEGIVSYHSETPECKDYTEEYQALYHAEMCKVLEERPWVWASHVWNMFDFGCSARDEGGVKGRNNKGLVTSDRKIKKDSFYVCKAHWSKEPFVHVCGARYACRSGETTRVVVCSNAGEVVLYANGAEVGRSDERVATFEGVPLREGTNIIRAEAGGLADFISVEKVEAEPASYTVPADQRESAHRRGGEGVKNWFEGVVEPEKKTPEFSTEHFSVKDKMGDLLANPEAKKFVTELMGQEIPEGMMAMIKSMTLERNLAFIGELPEGALETIEAKLAKIKK